MSRLFRDVEGESPCPQGSVVCIGAFDGLHRGHQALVGHARDRARLLDLPAVAVSFEPLPREFFGGDDPPPRLLLPRAKFEGLRALGMDVVGLLRFNAAMAAMPAENFVTRVLVEKLRAREVWVGPDFRFGNRRRGDLAMLQAMGPDHGFVAGGIEAVGEGERWSSTAIRAWLAEGKLDLAAKALGRRYAIAGKVVRGKQLGRKLGYPTANLRLAGKRPALGGIFATWVHGIGAGPLPSVSSLGTRPTVDGVEPLLEAHVFDFDGDLYGRRIEVEFVAKLRDEMKFDDLPALVRQMDEDALRAREALARDREKHGVTA
ncbi:MAG TPA: bifunctional riboflavin kinase/FAD synthetase [Arenimonas sp.]|jgi:riboflavin kinase/FMN adenylyltransferase|nr:bifunctional riboflavin kinase/FAD synthetase [Arenimonas sp.]